jgi:outer membrane lipoprotein SlyB
MRKFILAVSAAAMAVPATFALSTPADAQRRHHHQRYSHYYDRQGHYSGPTWRGRDGRYHCRRSNGTTGLLIGGAAGALIGRSVDGGRDRTAGTVIGAAAGALLGREVDRNNSGRRCR